MTTESKDNSDFAKMGFPAFGQGIFHPNLRNRFVVQFLGENNDQLPYGNKLSQQVIHVAGIIEFKEGTGGGGTTITFQDDCLNHAFKGLLNLQREQNLTIAIHQLDGAGKVLRTTNLLNAKVESFGHSDLDYAGSSGESVVEFNANFPSYVGEAIQVMQDNPVAAAILTALSGAQVRANAGPNNRISAVNELTAYVFYEATSYEFANLPFSG